MMNNSSAGSQTATALYNIIKDETVSAVQPKLVPVVQISSQKRPIDAANLLWKHNLLAVPVFDESLNAYVGYFDMRDVLGAILKSSDGSSNGVREEDAAPSTVVQKQLQAEMNEDTTTTSSNDACFDEELLQHTLQEESLNKEMTLESLAKRRPAYCCSSNDSLEHVCQLLSQSDCRRVLICDSSGKCSDVVSRSTIIRYLASQHNKTTTLVNSNETTLDQAGFEYRKEVISISENATAKQAFELILEKKLYGIAVVDEDDGTCLVGNTSARDVKLVALQPTNNTTDAFELDILSFLAGVRQEDSPESGKKAKFPKCHVRESSSVTHVLQLLAKTGYHRVFVTNEYMELVGVVSEQDILRFVLTKGKIQLPHNLSNVAE